MSLSKLPPQQASSALEKAITLAGGPTALADLIGGTTKPQHIVNWRNRGVPVDRVRDIVRATDGKVTAHELMPELFPSGFEFPPEPKPRRREAAA